MIKILFFGAIAEKIGKHEMMLSDIDGMSINDVVRLVKCEQFHPLLLAVNQQQENDLTTLLQDGDELAIMPPFSGG